VNYSGGDQRLPLKVQYGTTSPRSTIIAYKPSRPFSGNEYKAIAIETFNAISNNKECCAQQTGMDIFGCGNTACALLYLGVASDLSTQCLSRQY
jgi:hypothetical protein